MWVLEGRIPQVAERRYCTQDESDKSVIKIIQVLLRSQDCTVQEDKLIETDTGLS